MTPTETRLIIEVALVTMAFTGVLAVGLWAYVQARRNTPGAIAELAASNEELARRVRALERSEATNHTALLKLQTRMEMQVNFSRAQSEYIGKQAAYSETLADRLRQSGQDVPPGPGNPPTPPVELSEPLVLRPAGSAHLAGLSLPELLARAYNIEELDTLAGEIGALPENLLGQSIGRRAVSLVNWAQRHGCLDKLVEQARKERPNGGF